MRANRYQFGATRDGFIPTTRAVGSSGIAVITWAVESPRKTFDRSSGGRQCDDIFGRSNFTASEAIWLVSNVNERLYCTRPTIAEEFELQPRDVAAAVFK